MKRHFLNLVGVVAAMAVILPQVARGAETARSEWMRGYVKMENGDRNVAGNPAEALAQYREALEIFERVRRKYPTWNESLLNYRIKYCKEQIEKLGKNVGQKSTDMRRDDLVKLTKDQYTTITKLNDERKSLQSRVEVLTESLEKARAESARNAGVETSLLETTNANNELKEKIRVLELQLREEQKEVNRLKAQEGVAEELKKAQAELRLTVEQLTKTRETLTQTRLENDTLTRQARQQKMSIDSLTRERNDQDMAMKVVRELSAARKKENEVLSARFETLSKQAEDLNAALRQKDDELKRSGERVKQTLEEINELRALRTAEAEKMHKEQAAELASLRESLNQLVASSGEKAGGDTAVQRRVLENLSSQLSAKDAELAKLAQSMAALFADRERMMAQEEELTTVKKQLVEMTGERDRQRAQVLTSQENLMTLKGEYERTRTQLAAAEKQCKSLLVELDETKKGTQARGLEKEISTKETEDLLKRVKTAEEKTLAMEKRLEEQLQVSRRQEQETVRLRESLGKANEETAAVKEQMAAERVKLLDAAAKAAIDQEKFSVLKKQKGELDVQLGENEKRLAETRAKLAEIEGRLRGRETELAALQEEFKKLRASEAELRKRENDMMVASANLHKDDAAKLEQLQTQLQERSGTTLEKENSLKTLQEKLDKQSDELEKAAEENRRRAGVIAEKEAEVERLKASVEKLTGELKETSEAKKTLETQLGNAKATVAALEKTKDEMLDKVSAVDGMTKVVVDSTQTQKKQEENIKKMRQQLTIAEGQIREAAIRERTLKKQLDDIIKGGSSALVSHIKTLTEEKDAAEKRIKALEDVLADGNADNPQKPLKDERAIAKENDTLKRLNEALTRQNELLKTQNREQRERMVQATKTAAGEGQGTGEDRRVLEAKVASLEAALKVTNSELEVERASKGGGQAATETASETELRRENERREHEKQALIKGFVRQGLDAERQGKTEAARWNYNKVLSMQSDNKIALQRMGQLAYNQGDDATAIRYLKQAFYHDPDDAQTLFALGYSYARQSQADWAVATMGRAVALNPDNASMARVYGATLVQLGWTDAAEREFRRALKIEPKEKNAAFNLAVLLMNSASEIGHGLTTQTVAKMRAASQDWLKNAQDSGQAKMMSAVLDWMDYLARQAENKTAEAKKLYHLAKENGIEPDPALEKVLK